MEEVFLCDALNVGKEDTSKADFSIFVGGLIDIPYFDGDIKFCSGKRVFSDKLPVDAEDVCTTVN